MELRTQDNETENQLQPITSGKEGRVLPPMLLWFLGVPGFVCILLWLFVFRGH